MVDGDKVYMGGDFTTIGTLASAGQSPIAAAISYLDTTSTTWKAMATNANGPIYDYAIQSSTGRLWAVGGMTLLSPTLTGTGGVAYYDDDLSSWVYAGGLPTQIVLATESKPIKAIVFDSDSAAIIGGHPDVSAGVTPLYGLARLNPTTKAWATLGGGICGGVVEDLVVWNGQLFVAGNFTKVSDSAHDCGSAALDAPGFAVYDLSASTWSTLEANLTSGDYVMDLHLTDFSSRNATANLTDYLIVAGKFSELNGDTGLANLAKWDGTTWSALTSTVAPVGTGSINSVNTDGFNVYIGGAFTNANATNVAQWDGAQWNSLSSGLYCLSSVCTNASVSTVALFYELGSSTSSPVSGLDLSSYINWKWWLICLCAVVIAALVLSILTNCCWKVVSCCRGCCMNSKPRKKMPGL